MTYWKKNDFKRIEGGALIRVGNHTNVKRKSNVYITDFKKGGKKADGVREGKHIVLGLKIK